jgi:hypothetical protein
MVVVGYTYSTNPSHSLEQLCNPCISIQPSKAGCEQGHIALDAQPGMDAVHRAHSMG